LGVALSLKRRFSNIGKWNLVATARLPVSDFVSCALKIAGISLASMFAYAVLFYSTGSILFGGMFRSTDFINIACALTVAGYAGVLTPGVPGGIGVKESVSVMLVSAYGYDKGNVVIISLFTRGLSVIGDLLAFFIVTRLRIK